MGLAPLLCLLAAQAVSQGQIREWVGQLSGPEDSDATQYRPYARLLELGPAAVPALIEGIRSTKSTSYLHRVTQLLGEIDDERPARPLYEAALRFYRTKSDSSSSDTTFSLGRYRKAIPIILLSDFESRDLVRRRFASRVLVDLLLNRYQPGPELRRAVVGLLDDSDYEILRNGCSAAGQIRIREAGPRLAELMGQPRVAEVAATSLSQLMVPATVPKLLPALRFENYTGWNVAVQMRHFARPEHLKIILRFARENPGLPRAYAINLAGYLRDASAIPDLQAYRNDPLERARLAADNAIRRIQGILP